jgi:hypothetical protein
MSLMYHVRPFPHLVSVRSNYASKNKRKYDHYS